MLRHHSRLPLAAILSALLQTLTGCGDPECPDDSVLVGKRCLLRDAGADASATDAQVDAPPATDGCEPTRFHRDADGDGHGDPAVFVDACTAPEGHVEPAGDCDDTNDAVHPGATEICNSIDDDCDGAVDEGLLGTIGATIPLGDGPGGGDEVALDHYELGFVAVWVDGSYRLQLQKLSTTGASVGPATPVAEPLASAQQYQPFVRVMAAGGSPYAVVAWQEAHDWIRVRVFPLDGRPPPAAIDLEHDTTDFANVGEPVIAAVGSRAAIAWNNDPANAIRMAMVDVASSTVSVPATDVYSYEMRVGGFGRPLLHAAGTGSETVLLIGATDQRTGDTAGTGYLRLVSPSDLRPVAEPLRVRPVTTEYVFQMAAGGSAGDITLVVMSTSESIGNLHYAPLSVEADHAVVLGGFDTVFGSGLMGSSGAVPAGLLVPHHLIGDEPPTLTLWVSELLQAEGGRHSLVVAREDGFTGASAAAHPSGAAAVLYGAYSDSTGTSSVRLQVLGCE